MRLFEVYNTFRNWTFPIIETMKADFAEYKKKEDRKWKGRSKEIGARFPIFKDFEDFRQSLQNAEVVTVDESLDRHVANRSHTSSIDDLKGLVSGYTRPRDVDRITKGFKQNDPIPYPIILKGDKGMWIMAGNTRLDAAEILGHERKALMVDVGQSSITEDSKPNPNKVYHGSPQKFDKFRPGPEGAIFFIDDREVAEGFAGEGGYVYTVSLDVGNPYSVNTGGMILPQRDIQSLVRDAKREGHDALILKNVPEGIGHYTDQWAVFSNEQINVLDIDKVKE